MRTHRRTQHARAIQIKSHEAKNTTYLPTYQPTNQPPKNYLSSLLDASVLSNRSWGWIEGVQWVRCGAAPPRGHHNGSARANQRPPTPRARALSARR